MSQQTKLSELAVRICGAYAGSPIAPIRSELAELDLDAGKSKSGLALKLPA
jgi:2-keto-4-pentenoate hydratase